MGSARAIALGAVVRREVDERVVVALEVAQVPEHGADGRVELEEARVEVELRRGVVGFRLALAVLG